MGCAANKSKTSSKVKSTEVQGVDSAVLIIKSSNKLKSQRQNSALGCIFGAFIGDALGSALESHSAISEIALQSALEMKGGLYGSGPGQVTEASELSMCLLHGLSLSLPHYSPETLASLY